MKGIVYKEYGPPNVMTLMEDLSKPTIQKDTEVIVQVKAAGVNPADWKFRSGSIRKLFNVKFPAQLGFDYAGVIDSVGSKVTQFKVGDHVFGRLDPGDMNRGCYAEFVRVDTITDAIAMKPEKISFEEAGAMGVVSMTAYCGLIHFAKLNAGDRLLVVGASGGVGSMTCQVAKILGAHVTGICSGKNAEYVKGLGADKVVDYKQGSLEELLKDEPPFDMIYDCVGSYSYWKLAQKILKPNGTFVSATGEFAKENHDWSEPVGYTDVISFGVSLLWRMLTNSRKYVMITTLPVQFWGPLVDWIAQGKLQCKPLSVYPLEKVKEAHEQSQSGRTTGKIVLTI